MTTSEAKYWLLKAEPDSRVVKGKDVKFSVDDFETVGTSPWEGVRNYEARNLMKEMKEGDKALFYHSNCKNPGIAAFAKVSKEAYPDYTAWDASHPYYDPKTNEDAPKWFMVDLTFTARAKHFVPLSLLRSIAETPPSPSSVLGELGYVGVEGFRAVKSMDLVTRGRLSVQRVQEDAWKAIEQLAERGGWKEPESKSKNLKGTKRAKATAAAEAEAEVEDEVDGGEPADKPPVKKRGRKKATAVPQAQTAAPQEGVGVKEGVEEGDGEQETRTTKSKTGKRKREAEVPDVPDVESMGVRRSTRTRK